MDKYSCYAKSKNGKLVRMNCLLKKKIVETKIIWSEFIGQTYEL
jgi:hypothetical protein